VKSQAYGQGFKSQVFDFFLPGSTGYIQIWLDGQKGLPDTKLTNIRKDFIIFVMSKFSYTWISEMGRKKSI